jgi:hypothetical protein
MDAIVGHGYGSGTGMDTFTLTLVLGQRKQSYQGRSDTMKTPDLGTRTLRDSDEGNITFIEREQDTGNKY